MTDPTVDAVFRAHVADSGAQVLIDVPGGDVVTYAGAEHGAAAIGAALQQLGVAPGDRVAVQIEKSATNVLLYLACFRIGAVYVPLNPAYTTDELAYLLGDAEPTVVVVDRERAPTGDPWQIVTVDRVVATAGDVGGAALRAVEVTGDDLAAIVYTSGTTGRPKGAMLTHGNLAANASTLRTLWGFRPDDVLLHALPLYHVHGLFVAFNTVLLNGTGVHLLPRFDVDAVLAELPRSTVFMGVPTYYTRLLADPRLDREVTASMRLFVSGSAPLLASTHAEFFERTGHRILERYGMSETGMNTSNPLEGERRPGTVGPWLPDVVGRVVGDDDVPLPTGEVGELQVRGPNVLRGYWRRPELATSVFTADGFFRTGDLGRVDGDGYVEIVGRSKDLIISGGLNVYPKEVEAVLDELDGVEETAVVGVPDPDLGERVVAVVVPRPGASVDPTSIRAAARQRLAAFKVPKAVYVRDALPRNAMGKVEKARLRVELTENRTDASA